MSGECNNCETRQRLGRDTRCLVCIYFNAAIFNTGIPNTIVEHQETKVEKVINEENTEKTNEKLALIKALEVTIKNALELIGVDAPERM